MAFEGNETHSQGTLYSATENQVAETQKIIPVAFLMVYKEQKSTLVVKISEVQPDSPALYSRNNHKSKLSLYKNE